LRLLADAALNTVVGSLAREGGLASTLWAGPETIARSVCQGEHEVEGTRRQQAVSLKVGFAGAPFSYCIDLGYPPPAQLAFPLDPAIKREFIWHGRFLLWTAALLTPRPPELMVLNEPETSLHPDLLPPLARLIALAAARTQIIVVSHSPSLIESLEKLEGCPRLHLEKSFGETTLAGQTKFNIPKWEWPTR